MIIHRKHLIRIAVAVIVLFVAADPLGDAHHGLGAHNHVAAVVGQVLWVAALLGAALFIVSSVVGLLQVARRAVGARR